MNNIFEYLSKSSKIDPCFLRYTHGFKGPHAKNQIHQKFSKFLQAKYASVAKANAKTIEKETRRWMKTAITHFGKQEDYIEYKERKQLYELVMTKYNKIKSINPKLLFSEFKRYLLIYGIMTIVKLSDDELVEHWNKFWKENWSGLMSI